MEEFRRKARKFQMIEANAHHGRAEPDRDAEMRVAGFRERPIACARSDEQIRLSGVPDVRAFRCGLGPLAVAAFASAKTGGSQNGSLACKNFDLCAYI